jgi:hypothetical protein
MKGAKNHWETYEERLGKAQFSFGGVTRGTKKDIKNDGGAK